MTPKPQWEIEWDNNNFESIINCPEHECRFEVTNDIKDFIRSQIETSYQQGVEDMRRRCVGIVKEKSDSVGECIEEIEKYKSN